MVSFEVPVNIFLLAGLSFLGILLVITFIVRSARLTAMQKRILELEREMLENHALILDLQKEV